MNITFENLVEEVKKLSFIEKEESNFLLDKYLIETKREEIKSNYTQAKQVCEIQSEQMRFRLQRFLFAKQQT